MVSGSTEPAAAGEGGRPGRRWRSGTSPRDLIARWVLTLLLVGLIVLLFARNLDDMTAVVDDLAAVPAGDAVLLVVLLLVARSLVGAQLAFAIPGLGWLRGCVCSEGAAAASNIIPGPSGTATRLVILTSWGYRVDDFARSWLLTSALTNLTVLAGPGVAALVLAAELNLGTTILIIGAVGLVASTVGVVVVGAIMRSEGAARRCGRLGGRVVRWWNGLRHRTPSPRDFEAVTLTFRADILQSWHERGGRVSAAVVGNYLVTGLMLVLSVRAVGLDRGAIATTSIIAVYTAVRLLTVVNITPGGAGVTEALYITGLVTVAPDVSQSTIVAAVLLFRGLTYVGPIILGAISLVVWRAKGSWKAPTPAEGEAVVAVGGALAGQQPVPVEPAAVDGDAAADADPADPDPRT